MGTRSVIRRQPIGSSLICADCRTSEIRDDSLITAKGHLAEALEELVMVLRSPEALEAFGDVDRGNLAKYLTISKLKLENAIALVRSGTTDRES